jgi:hypothetical protein
VSPSHSNLPLSVSSAYRRGWHSREPPPCREPHVVHRQGSPAAVSHCLLSGISVSSSSFPFLRSFYHHFNEPGLNYISCSLLIFISLHPFVSSIRCLFRFFRYSMLYIPTLVYSSLFLPY